MHKFFASTALAAVLALTMFAAAPAQAQVWSAIDNVNSQVNSITSQSASASASAGSAGRDATAAALAFNVGNMHDVFGDVDILSHQIGALGSVATEIDNATGQSNSIGTQAASAVASASGVGRDAVANATAMNIGNMSGVTNTIKAVTSRH